MSIYKIQGNQICQSCSSKPPMAYHVCRAYRKATSVTWCPCLQNADSNAHSNCKTLIVQENNYMLREVLIAMYFDG